MYTYIVTGNILEKLHFLYATIEYKLHLNLNTESDNISIEHLYVLTIPSWDGRALEGRL